MDIKQMSQDICGLLSDKKGSDIIIIDVREATVVCDYFIICSAKSAPQVRALCDNVEEGLEKKYDLRVKSKDGYSDGRWIVMDYFDIVVHIFNDETRLFYHLEKLWTNGDNVIRYEEIKEPTLKPKKATKKATDSKVKKPVVRKVVAKDVGSAEAKPAKKATTKKAVKADGETKPLKKPVTAKRSTIATSTATKAKKGTNLTQ